MEDMIQDGAGDSKGANADGKKEFLNVMPPSRINGGMTGTQIVHLTL